MSLREWLIAIGTLVIIGIVVDGIRRMHRARKESIAISSGMGADDLEGSPLDDDYNPELPNGGARTISTSTLEQRGYVRRPSDEPAKEVSGRGEREDRTADDPGEELSLSASEEESDTAISAGWGALDDSDSGDEIIGKPRVLRPGIDSERPEPEPSDSAGPAPVPGDRQTRTGNKTTATEETGVQADTASRAADRARKGQPLAGANRPEAREVIVINVLAPEGNSYKGSSLKALFEACGLELGDMDIYHRHEQSDTTSPVQFSVASAVEPGTFRPQEMDNLSTPGISFFMSLPGPGEALQAFDFMLETAQCVVRNLGGELKDERRSVMTPQTAEHCRQRIREFERKQRSPVH